MKTKILTKTAASAVIFAVICAMAALSEPHQTADTQTALWYSIVPPLIKTQKSTQAATALMGLIYFIDDYSNAVIVGSSMRPFTDRFGISREKLAFLVDTTSHRLVGVCSTPWRRRSHRTPMKNSKSNTKIPVATKIFFEASWLRHISHAS